MGSKGWSVGERVVEGSIDWGFFLLLLFYVVWYFYILNFSVLFEGVCCVKLVFFFMLDFLGWIYMRGNLKELVYLFGVEEKVIMDIYYYI